jgi:hypothetical protein
VLGQRDAVPADEHARAGDQLAHLVLGFTAERAGQLWPVGEVLAGLAVACPAAVTDPDPAAGTAGFLDDLVHALVAEPEVGGQLAQGGAVQVQAPDGPVELGAGHGHVAFGVDQPVLGLLGLGQ